MAYISVFPTISTRFWEQPTDWRDMREQATPVLNKVLDELTKKSNFKQQCIFLMKCRDCGIAPKGLKVQVPKGIMSVDQEGRFKRKCESELVQKRKYLVSAPVLGHTYLLIKVHKKNFPGRAVVSQIDDPTYKICKILTDILNPLAINGQSFVENSYDLKKTLAMIQVDKDDIQASFDVIDLYPSIPIDKALDCIRERLQKDETLSERTEWKPNDIVNLLQICLETHFKTLDGRIFTQIKIKQTEHPLDHRYQVLLQTSI